MSRIRVLPEAIASRIAAGEVVERPASVVKELVENAIDAGATRIEVTLEDGGKRAVVVRDDGHGMDRDDALLAFQQHATSKVDTDGDLSKITTRGFRGEALPAIASCSKVTLVTSEAAGEGTRVRIERGVLRDVAPVGAPRGTSVEVRDLFGALPARRKFLRAPATELSHVVRDMELQALASPALHLMLTQDRTLLDLPAADSQDARVSQVMGKDFAAAALRASGERGDLAVRSWLVRSGVGPGRLAGLLVLVNGRAVSDRVVAHAVREAARALFGASESPAGVVMLTLPEEDVDANVHPAKREVRFARPGEVHDAVRDLLRASAFERGAFAPALDDASGAARIASVPPLVSRDAWERTMGLPLESKGIAEGAPALAAAPGRWTAGPAPMEQGHRVLGQHRNTYILIEDARGLLLIDQHCAHERVLYERILAGLGKEPQRQALLQPVIVELPRAAAAVVSAALPDLLALGLEIDAFGEGAFAVRALPASAGQLDPAEVLREVAARDEPAAGPLERIRHLAATVACKAAVKAGFPLAHERMRWIADALMAAEIPTTCPHGRVALLRITDQDLDQRFGRP